MTQHAPVERYLASIRRARVVYAAVVAVVVVVACVIFAVAYAHGEVAHTTLRTTDHPPATIALQTPSANQQLAWRTSDRLAIGTPLIDGTVITYSAHTVSGRDARTGATTWSYSRSDRTVCTAAQSGGTTIAVYELAGNCDEVTALGTTTGERVWTRTLDEDGMPIFGHPTYQVTPSAFVVTTASVIYTISPTSGIDVWTYHRYGCAITGAVLGSAGALISQNCTKPQCSGIKFCRAGPQLFLRNGVAIKDDSSKPNFDKIIWNDYGNTDRPAVADQVVGALDPATHELVTFDPDSGKTAGTVRLAPAPSTTSGAVALPDTGGDLLWVGGVTYALSNGTGPPDWATRTLAAPSLVSPSQDLSPILSTARLSVPTSSGVADLDGNTGRAQRTFTLSGAPTNPQSAFPIGTGYAVSGSGGTAVYR